MDGYEFSLSGARLTALPSGALWWEDAGILCVSDLHLGKSERMARRGGPLLPPYETQETLARLGREISQMAPRTVICLGDSFDDSAAGAGLATPERQALAALIAGRRWIWIAGNHDPTPASFIGTHVEELERGPLIFRHITRRLGQGGEVSGHFHPKMRVAASGRMITRPCFLLSGQHLIMPAFGCYTGGLRVDDPVFSRLTDAGALAILTGRKSCAVPIAAAAASA